MRGSFAYVALRRILRPVVRRCYRIHVEGIDRVPTGPLVLSANHRSFMDSVFLAAVMPRPVTFLAKAEYFDRPASRWLFSALGQIPIRRGSGASAREAMARAEGVLASGGVVAIYPEGTRSRDGKLHRGNIGPARLALGTGAPLVPVGLIGTEEVQAPGSRLPHMFRDVTVRIGTPVEIPSEATLRAVTDRLMERIAHLCEQEYADTFAA
jgi:1-acyl-sn-glycerol-3-phosphate acyltransferase